MAAPPNNRMKRTAPASWSAAAYASVLQTQRPCRAKGQRGPPEVLVKPGKHSAGLVYDWGA